MSILITTALFMALPIYAFLSDPSVALEFPEIYLMFVFGPLVIGAALVIRGRRREQDPK